MMDLLCCVTRTRAEKAASESAGPSLFSKDRRFGSQIVLTGAEGMTHRPSFASPSQASGSLARPDFFGGSASARGTSSSDEDCSPRSKPESLSPSSSPRKHLAVTAMGNGRSPANPDPFLQNGTEAAALSRLQQLALSVSSEVHVRPQPPSKSHGSLLPPGAPSERHIELVPGPGTGFEPWVASEIVLSQPGEASADRRELLASVRLLRVTKVRHLDRHDGGRSMRLRLQQADSREVCEEILTHASPQQAKACSEALVEAINLVRALAGRAPHRGAA